MMATGLIECRLELVRRGGRGLGSTDPWEHVCEVGKMAPRWGTIQTGVVSDRVARVGIILPLLRYNPVLNR